LQSTVLVNYILSWPNCADFVPTFSSLSSCSVIHFKNPYGIFMTAGYVNFAQKLSNFNANSPNCRMQNSSKENRSY